MKVLFLVVDCLRYDYLRCYGNKEMHTPTMDRLADEGVQFGQAIATATWTPPSTSAMITGIYPYKLGIYRFNQSFPPQVKTLFHYFLEEGYTVGSYVFDEKYLFSKLKEANVQGNFRDFSKPLEWIEKYKDENFFLYMHYYWTHGPYEPKDSAEAWSKGNEKIKRMLREDDDGVNRCKIKYKKAVERMDKEWLSMILETLDRLSIADETLVILTGDHGESWGGRYDDRSKIITNFNLHGELLYDELLRIPLIMRFPAIIPKNKVINEQVRHIDIVPTVLELLNIGGKHERQDIDGVSLVDMIDGKWIKGNLPTISSATTLVTTQTTNVTTDKMALRDPDWKFIWSSKDNSEELYNLKRDPAEEKNVVKLYPAVASRMRKVLVREIENAPERKITRNEQQEIQNHLRGLGYI